MIEVVVVDDLEYFRNTIKDIVINEFKERNIKTEVFCFSKYDKYFWNHIKSKKTYRLFILDIEVPGISGIDAARRIREFDLSSDIIFITAYDTIKYKNLILFSTIKPLSFLNKTNIKKDLIQKIDYISNILKNVRSQTKTIVGKNKLNTYRIVENNIDFIEVNKINHKLVIYLSESILEIDSSLENFEKKINTDTFFKTHRSCIVNLKNIYKVDYKNKCIIFYSGKQTKLLARNKKKELKDRLKDKQY